MPTTLVQHRSALAAHGDRLRRYVAGEIDNDSWRPLRLSYGLYYQLDHTSHMQRIKVAGGLLTADQLDALAEVTERYGRGISHVTTRQDLQIHWVALDQVMDLYDRLLAVDITTRGACADTVRNVTACPFAGVSPDEPFDVAPYCLAVHDYFLFNPLNLTLPRKFKIAIEGCPLDCAQVPINDIGVYAKLDGEARGFSVWAGGGLGSQPFLAVPIRDFIPAEDLLVWCEAIVRVQHRHGERKNRSRARMKYVVKKMGVERFRATVEDEVARVAAERGDALRAEVRHWVEGYRLPAPAGSGAMPSAPRPGFAHWRRTNVRPARQPGFANVVVQLPLGDVTVEEMHGLAALVRRHGNGTLRATNDQNFVLPLVADGALAAVHADLEDLGLGNADAQTIADVVSCPGMDYCSLAITRSMGVAERVREHLLVDPVTANGFAAALGSFAVKVSGCPNSCGQYHVGDIGLTGHSVTGDDGVQRPYYSILVGGSVGEGRGRVGRRIGRFAEEETPQVIVALARFFERERQDGEQFPEFLERVGIARATAVATGAVGAS